MTLSPDGKSAWKHVYFVGIGGIGMSALARWFNVNGFLVAGYDRTPTTLTDTLEQEGITVCFDDAVDQVPTPFLAHPADTLIRPGIGRWSISANIALRSSNARRY